MLARCTKCDKARDNVLEVSIRIAGRVKTFNLCVDCRRPFEVLMDLTPGKARGRRRTQTVVAIDPADIPLDRPPSDLKPLRKR